MTNYNERLEEVLNMLGERHIMVEHRLIHLGMPEQNGKNIETRKAKQAITSLIKELVTEAKPKNNWLEGSDLFYGQDEGVGEFERNLLKELEEV